MIKGPVFGFNLNKAMCEGLDIFLLVFFINFKEMQQKV
jgi:hypothetical protein